MNTKTSIKVCTATVLLSQTIQNVKAQEASSQHPNIIYIMSDDHGYQAMSCYGSKINTTPNLDKIANEGMIFNNCFVTNSVSAPSRAVLLTGKYSHVNGQLDNMQAFDGSQLTFPKIMQKNGYQTALIGKWHLKSRPTGFDFWEILRGQGEYYNPVVLSSKDTVVRKGYVTNILTDDAIKFIDNRDKTKPFCLLLLNKAPHRNWMPDSAYYSMYQNKQFAIPSTFFDDYSTRSEAAHVQEMSIAKDMNLVGDLKLTDAPNYPGSDYLYYELKRMNPDQSKLFHAAYDSITLNFRKNKLTGKDLALWKYNRYIADYLRCIASVDDNVGRLLDYLKANGLDKNTIIIYTSDQGFYLGEHGWFDKRFMYEQSLRTPLVIKNPGHTKAGSINNNFVMNLDYAETILDLAGINPPKEMQGRSFKPLLENKPINDWRKSIYYHYYEFPAEHNVKRHYGVRTERYKLIHFYYDIDAWELYDLKNDSNEVNNVYDNAAYAGIVKDMKVELQKLMKQYGDNIDDTLNYSKPLLANIKNLAKDADVKLKYPASTKYNGGSNSPLTDGIINQPNAQGFPRNYKNWLGFEHDDLDVVIDLKKDMMVNKISARFMDNPDGWIFAPVNVEISTSIDGKTYTSQKLTNDKVNVKGNALDIYTTNLKKANVRYIKVVAHNIGTCPKGHPGEDKPAWLFIDEVIVE